MAIRLPKRRKRRDHPAMMHSAYDPGPHIVQLPPVELAPTPPPPVTVVGSLGHRASSVLVEPTTYTSSMHGRGHGEPPVVQPPLQHSATNSSFGGSLKWPQDKDQDHIPTQPPPPAPVVASEENPSPKSSLPSMGARSFISS